MAEYSHLGEFSFDIVDPWWAVFCGNHSVLKAHLRAGDWKSARRKQNLARRLLRTAELCGFVALMNILPSGMAQAEWCTVTGPGTSACAGTPMAACAIQHNAYAPSRAFYGYTDTRYWYSKQCSWSTALGVVFPTSVTFQCPSGYRVEAPGSCVPKNEDFQMRNGPQEQEECGSDTVKFNGGGSETARTRYPIDVMSGAKLFHTVDFKTEDGSLQLDRFYNSIGYSGVGGLIAEPLGLGTRWHFWFQSELHIDWNFFNNGSVDIATPDGGLYNFTKSRSSNVMTANAAIYGTVQKDYELEFIGTWPSDLGDVLRQSTQWQLRDPDDRIWILQTYLNPTTGTYDIAHPISVTLRGGLQLTFAYGSHNELSSITDSYGKAISFDWIIQDSSTLGNPNAIPRPAAISKATLPDGTTLHYFYEAVDSGLITLDQPDRLIKVERQDVTAQVVNSTTYLYENAAFPFAITGIKDKDGVLRWTVEYDADGHAITSTGPNNTDKITVAYGSVASPGFTRTVTNALGKQTVYNYYWSYGNVYLTSVIGNASDHCPASTRSYTYASRLISSIADAEGRVSTYSREPRGLPTQVVSGFGTTNARTVKYSWGTNFRVPTEIVQPGLKTNFSWNSSGQLMQVVRTDTTSTNVPYSTNGQTRTWSFTYDSYGHLLTADGPLAGTGDTVTYSYDASGYLASVTDELGHITTISSVNGRGQPTSILDQNGTATNLGYDSEGRLNSVTVDPGSNQAVTSIEYNAVDQITKITRPNGAYLQYTYDDGKRLTKVEDNSGASIEYNRDNLGNVTARRIKNSGGTVEFSQAATYDELGRLLTSIGADGQTWTYGYDKTNNLVSRIDPRLSTYHWAFDSLNRLISETDEESAAVTLTRNGKDEVTNYSDPRSLNTSYVRDGFGGVIQRTSPDSGTTVYEYNALGKVTKITDGRGVEINLSYDNAGRLLTKQYPAATSENITYTWDSTAGGNKGIGRVTKIEDASGSVEWTYNAVGQITQEKKTTAGVAYVVGYTYDPDGNVTQMTYPSGRVVSFSRDLDGRISAVTARKDAGSASVTLATGAGYLPFGPLTSLTYGNGLTLTRTYTQDYRINALQVQDVGTSIVVLERSYSFADGVNLTGIADNLTAARSEAYVYTAANRLREGNGIWGTLAWTYDATGNRSSEMLTSGSSTTSTYDYPSGNNRLSSVTQGSTTVRSFAYDGAGNITADTRGSTAYRYHYNNRNRLDELTIGSTLTADYTYDGLERLAIRTTQNTTPAATTHYVYDLAGRLIAEATGTGTTVREYIWFDDMPLAVVSDVDTSTPNLYYVHADHLNRPIKMTDGSEAVVWDAVYKPFGEAYSVTGSASNNLRFPGQYFLLESGLAYNWYRHYDPTLGRYTQPDPIADRMRSRRPSAVAEFAGSGLTAESAMPLLFQDGPSIYAYARSAPTQHTDANGLQAAAVVRGGARGIDWLCARYPAICTRAAAAATQVWNYCRNTAGSVPPSDGGNDYKRCRQAANGSTDDWEEFCRGLGSNSNNVVGGQTIRRACWEKTYEPRRNKLNWCENQYGG